VRLLGKGEITAKIDIEVAGASAGRPRKRSRRRVAASPPPTFKKKVYKQQEGRAGQASEAAAPIRRKKRAAPPGLKKPRLRHYIKSRYKGQGPPFGPMEPQMPSAAEQLAANFQFSPILARPMSCASGSFFTLGALDRRPRLGTYIPMPGIDPDALAAQINQQGGGPARHFQHPGRRRRSTAWRFFALGIMALTSRLRSSFS